MPETHHHGTLIHGENLEVLTSLAPELRDRVRAIYLDPPYNTGERKLTGDHAYDDDHRDWLGFMRPRLEVMIETLRADGSLFVQLDDNQLDRTRVALDELLGPQQFIARVTVDARAPSAFSTVNPGLFKASEYLLWYAKDRARFRWNPLRVPRDPDPAYRMWLENPSAAPQDWTFTTLRKAAGARDLARFQVEQAERVCRLASVSDRKAGRATVLAKQRSLATPDRVEVVERSGQDPQYLLRGQQLLFYDRQVSWIDGVRSASRPLTNIWTDISWEGIASEGGVRFKQGKKPERLLRRVLQLATEPGDLVLDAFCGAGTTAAVAHKMGRNWLTIEQGEQVALAAERLKRVVHGQDPTGVTRLEDWRGGGSMRVRCQHGDTHRGPTPCFSS